MLKKQESVRTTELSEIFNTSRQTINSDINHLDKLGKLTKVHGGAVRAQSSKEPSIQYREVSYLDEKNLIAERAASYIEEGDSIYLDIGTTVRAMTPFLKEFKDLTIITNAVGLAYELGRDTQLDIILAGGSIRNRELATSGTHTVKMVENYYVDKSFIGAGGVTVDSGITDYYLDEAEVRKTMLTNSRVKFALFDQSKLGVNALVKVADLEDFDWIISCNVKDEHFINYLADEDINFKNLQRLSVDRNA
jgi:DeoR family fructose operon transcriptional repressor